jgi:hypothetical protein
MSRRTLATLGVLAAVIAAALAVFFYLRGRERSDTAADRAGAALAAGLEAAIEGAAEITAPHRCARLAEPDEPLLSAETRTRLEARKMSLEGRTLRLGANGKRKSGLVLGVVADSRGADSALVAEQAKRIRRQLEKSSVRVLLSLGGMGETRAQIVAALAPLASGAPWPVIALPGDRESLEEHRAAIAELNRDPDAVVLDGSEIRFVSTGAVVLGTLPGAAHASRLVAGAEGCQYTAADADALAEALLEHEQTRVWATHAPPRQAGPNASDLAPGGVHIGTRELTAAVATSKASVVIHALLDEAAARQRPGTKRLPTTAPIYLACGAMDRVPVEVPGQTAITGAALVVSIAVREVRWRPILFEGKRPRYPVR